MITAETASKLVLTGEQIEQKIVRLAFEIYENNFEEQSVFIAGIQERGYLIATLLAEKLRSISPLSVELISVEVEKEAPQQSPISLTIPETHLQNKVVILVDDVLNTGRTLAYALKPFLNSEVKKLETAVLVDRGYPQFPVSATYVGYALATTLQELVEVKFEENLPVAIYLR